MKKFTKILSLVLAVTLVASLFTVNVMAASRAKTITIAVKDADGNAATTFKAGDKVTIELTVDNTLNLVGFNYSLTYDSTAFTADTAKTNRLENCIDPAWNSTIIDANGDWAYYLGNPTKNVSIPGKINYQWAGSEAVEAGYDHDDYLIGKFYLTVNEDANGSYQFALTGTSMDGGENEEADHVCAPVTVTVGSGTPAGPSIGAGSAAGAGSGLANIANAYAVTVSMTGIKDAVSSAGVEFIPAAVYTEAAYAADGAWDLAAKATFSSTKIGKGDADFVAHLMGIPVDTLEAGVDMKARAFFVKDGVTTYGSVIDQLVKK